MKKIIVLLFLVFGIFTLVSAQSLLPSGYHNFDQSAIYVYGFDGNKPLQKNTMVEVTEVLSNGIIMILDPSLAYKGETKKKFLNRIILERTIATPINSVKTVSAKKGKEVVDPNIIIATCFFFFFFILASVLLLYVTIKL